MARPDNYAELVAQAERAVQSVKDPELKRVAFEKVLDDLLNSGTSQPAQGGKAKATRSKKSGGTTTRKGSRARGPKGYIREMKNEGFFKKPKTIAQVKAELENRGHHIPLTSLSGPLQSLCRDRVLRRQKKKVGEKQTYIYSEW